VFFLQIGLEVVPQAVIQGEFPRDLPAILRVQPQAVLARLGLGVRTNLHIVRQSQYKAGVIETGGIGKVKRLEILPRIGGFGVGNAKSPIGAPSAVLRISIDRKFTAVLERVVPLNPSQIGVSRRLLLPEEGNEGRTDSPASRSAIAAAEDVIQASASVEESADRGEAVALEISVHA
jgi:hypothetical protein